MRISIYIWEHPLIAEAVEKAVNEGVDVRVVIDGSKPNNSPMIERLRESIGAERVTACPGACVGSGINHNKFVLISRLAQGAEGVVVQSTGNWRLHYRYNTMVVIHGDSSIYQAYRSYWDDLNAQRHDPNYYDSHVSNGDADFIAPLKLYIFQRATGGDTVVSILNNVTGCPTGSTIRVAMGDFTNPRQEVAARLEALRLMGCNVHVFTVEDLGAQVLSTLGGEASPRLHLHALSDPTRVHSKYLAIDAEYYNRGRRKLVWFGSHNLTGPALRSNDETLLRIENDLVWQAFMSNWYQMHQRPHRNHPTAHP